MRRDAVDILQNAIDAVDPYTAVRNHFQRMDNKIYIGEKSLDLESYEEIVVVAFGKASSAMATATIQQLNIPLGDNQNKKSPRISGLVICKDDHATSHEERFLKENGILLRFASHPVPDERSSEAAQELLTLVEETSSPKTLVLCCISGGGSALFCSPRYPLTLPDLQQTNSVLLASGMGIQDMNVIRKRLEDGKGGRLASRSHPSTVVTLVLSDVLGDPLDLIASGPTVPDTSTWKDAWRLVQNNNLIDKLPARVRQLLNDGVDQKLDDSPSPEDPVFQKSLTVLVGNNDLAVEAAAARAHKLGYEVRILGSQVVGEAKEIAHIYTAMALYLQQQQEKRFSPYAITSSLPAALIAGGETTVSLPSYNAGRGGRNQELALSAALQLNSLGLRNVVLASVGTDGTDGPTDAAGAVVDATTVSKDTAAAERAVACHDAYTYLSDLSSRQGEEDNDSVPPLIKTGPTGTNVADVCVTLIR